MAMPRPKKTEETNEPQKQSKLNQILWDIHNDIKQVEDLVELLEGIPAKRNEQHESFCKSYTILLFRKYIENEDDREIMLVACGLMKGFEFQEQQLDKRMTDYRQYAQEYNPWIKKAWSASSYSTNYRNKLKDIVGELEKTLLNVKNQNGGRIGIDTEVPRKLRLPKPRYVSNTIRAEADKKNKQKLFKKYVFSWNICTSSAAITLLACIVSNMLTNIFTDIINGFFNNDNEPVIKDIQVYEPEITLYPDHPSEHLNIAISPTNADIRKLSYSSSNTAAIIADGQFVFLAPKWTEADTRNATITIEADDVANKETVVIAKDTNAPSIRDEAQDMVISEDNVTSSDLE